jgi:hypothetical protein
MSAGAPCWERFPALKGGRAISVDGVSADTATLVQCIDVACEVGVSGGGEIGVLIDGVFWVDEAGEDWAD